MLTIEAQFCRPASTSGGFEYVYSPTTLESTMESGFFVLQNQKNRFRRLRIAIKDLFGKQAEAQEATDTEQALKGFRPGDDPTHKKVYRIGPEDTGDTGHKALNSLEIERERERPTKGLGLVRCGRSETGGVP